MRIVLEAKINEINPIKLLLIAILLTNSRAPISITSNECAVLIILRRNTLTFSIKRTLKSKNSSIDRTYTDFFEIRRKRRITS